MDEFFLKAEELNRQAIEQGKRMQYNEALRLYTAAIELYPSSTFFYNRAMTQLVSSNNFTENAMHALNDLLAFIVIEYIDNKNDFQKFSKSIENQFIMLNKCYLIANNLIFTDPGPGNIVELVRDDMLANQFAGYRNIRFPEEFDKFLKHKKYVLIWLKNTFGVPDKWLSYLSKARIDVAELLQDYVVYENLLQFIQRTLNEIGE